MLDPLFYVGPLGSMRALPNMAGTISTPLQVIGGTHVSLSGAYTRDVFGFKRSWTWSYEALTMRQTQYVEALQRGLVAGPIYLIDPRRPNRLPEQIASGGSQQRSATGFIPSNTSTCVWDAFPTITGADQSTLPAAQLLRGAVEWQVLSSGTAGLELAETANTGFASDGRLNIAAIPSETVVGSAWLLGPTGQAVTLTVTAYNTAKVAVGSASTTVNVSPTAWTQAAATLTCPASCAYTRVTFTAPSAPAASIWLTALQVATPDPESVQNLWVAHDYPDPDPSGGWRLGGGAPQVVPDVGDASYLYPGVSAMALTLTER